MRRDRGWSELTDAEQVAHVRYMMNRSGRWDDKARDVVGEINRLLLIDLSIEWEFEQQDAVARREGSF